MKSEPLETTLETSQPSPSWFTVEEIDPTTYSLAEYGQWMKLHSYLFIGSDRSLLFDTGLGVANIHSLATTLTSQPITVISTHAHWDHIGNHDLFPDVWIHPSEKDWLVDGYAKEEEEIREYLLERPFTIKPPQDFKIEDYRPPRCQPTSLIDDEQTINLGNRIIKLYHTPGHSPGHICAHEPARGYLVTGDLLYQGTLLAGLEDSDPLTYLASLRRISKLPDVNKLLPAHGRLEIKTDLLEEAISAFEQLNRLGKLEKGSGTHPFQRMLIQL